MFNNKGDDMEIHFYESKEYYPKDCEILHDFVSVRKALDNKIPIVHTTQMCELKMSWILDGYRLFVHQDDGFVYEITERTQNNCGQRAIRISQNAYAMWASGVFRGN